MGPLCNIRNRSEHRVILSFIPNDCITSGALIMSIIELATKYRRSCKLLIKFELFRLSMIYACIAKHYPFTVGIYYIACLIQCLIPQWLSMRDSQTNEIMVSIVVANEVSLKYLFTKSGLRRRVLIIFVMICPTNKSLTFSHDKTIPGGSEQNCRYSSSLTTAYHTHLISLSPHLILPTKETSSTLLAVSCSSLSAQS